MATEYYPLDRKTSEDQDSPRDGKRDYSYGAAVAEDEEERLNKLAVADRRIKRRVRLLRVIQRCTNLIVSILVLGTMINTYITYTHNRTATNSSGQSVTFYPKDAITWPTFLMLGTAAVSFIFNVTILVSYYYSVGTANKFSDWAGYYGYVITAINVIIWLATGTTFKMMQGDPSEVPPPRDLFGWTCSDAADELKQTLPNVINLDLQCTTQQVSFALSIINASLEILGVIIVLITIRRRFVKKKLSRLQSRTNSVISLPS